MVMFNGCFLLPGAEFYVTVDKQKIADKSIYYFFFTKNIWVNSLTKIGEYNYIVCVDYDNQSDVNNLIGNFKLRAINFQIRRIFKSMKIIKAHKEEPTTSFLDTIIILISAQLKNTTIKVVGKTANDWKNTLLTRWQEELDHPKKFITLGIKPTIDISPDGKLKFHLNKVGDYIITYFEGDISKYYTSIKKEK
jgi:hypothetical protein